MKGVMIVKKNLKLRKSLLKNCLENGLIINPHFSVDDWCLKVEKKGGCPCVPGRSFCPCNESKSEIESNGICKCNFFMTPQYYLEMFLKANS